MKTNSIQMTASLWVNVSAEDLDLIWACAEAHYDSTVQGMTRQGGLLYGIKNQLGEADSTEVHLHFRDLDTMAKALEQSHLLGLVGGLKLHGKIHDMLRLINANFSTREIS